jgi:hypothetical protein
MPLSLPPLFLLTANISNFFLHTYFNNLEQLNMTTTALTEFFVNDVDRLPDTWYVDHNDECGICRVDKTADPPVNNDTNISMTAVVSIKTCGHIFHEVCLHGWLRTPSSQSFSTLTRGTCPMCRVILVTTTSEAPTFSQTEFAAMQTLLTNLEARINEHIEETGRSLEFDDTAQARDVLQNLILRREQTAEMRRRFDTLLHSTT